MPKTSTWCVDLVNRTKIASVFFIAGGIKTSIYLFRRNVRILPYNVNFPVKTIESIQVIFVRKRSTQCVDIVNRTKGWFPYGCERVVNLL